MRGSARRLGGRRNHLAFAVRRWIQAASLLLNAYRSGGDGSVDCIEYGGWAQQDRQVDGLSAGQRVCERVVGGFCSSFLFRTVIITRLTITYYVVHT